MFFSEVDKYTRLFISCMETAWQYDKNFFPQWINYPERSKYDQSLLCNFFYIKKLAVFPKILNPQAIFGLKVLTKIQEKLFLSFFLEYMYFFPINLVKRQENGDNGQT